MKSNTIFTAIKQHLLNKIKEIKWFQVMSRKVHHNSKKVINEIKEPNKIKINITDKKKKVVASTENLLDKASEVKIKNKLYYIVGGGCVLLTLITAIFSSIAISEAPKTRSVYKHDTVDFNADAFANTLTNNWGDVYNGNLKDGKVDFLTTNNIGAANTVDADSYFVRNKQEQYDSLKINNTNLLLSLVIKTNSAVLFKKYTSNQIALALDVIKEYLYQEILFKFIVSNATNLNNYFRSFGYSGRSDYLEKVILPKTYLYFYLLTRMAETSKDDQYFSSFNAENVLNNNVFRKTWGIKIAKNYAKYRNSTNIYCNGLDSITSMNGPSNLQWNKVGSCPLVNGDATIGRKSVGTDEKTGKNYIGYLGILSATDESWRKFCDFSSAQLCADHKYGFDAAPLQTTFELFKKVISEDNKGNGFLFGNLVDLKFNAKGDKKKKTLLFPFDNAYQIIRTNDITSIGLVEDNDKSKLDVTNAAGLQALVSFIRSLFREKPYYNFCASKVNNDFSFQASSTNLDVEMSVFDTYSTEILNNFCKKGIE